MVNWRLLQRIGIQTPRTPSALVKVTQATIVQQLRCPATIRWLNCLLFGVEVPQIVSPRL